MAKNSAASRRPSQEEIAACAHLIYEKEGRPEGKAMQHWLQAEAQLTAERKAQSAAATKTIAPVAPPTRTAQIANAAKETQTAVPQRIQKN